MTDRTLLVDGDMLVYRSCVAVEKDTRFLDRYHILFSDADAAWAVLESQLADLHDIAGTSDVYLAFSDPDDNFRRALSGDDYKSNRAGQRKPLAYWEVRERGLGTFHGGFLPRLEADDMLGIMMTSRPDDFILWSLDKDLKQIPGPCIVDEDVIVRHPLECDQFFYRQVLSGDTTDGYSGCPGVGGQTAQRVIEDFVKLVPEKREVTRGPRKGEIETRWVETPSDNYWDIVVSHYEKAGLTEDDALLNARMAKILRAEDYENGKVKLWEPR